MSNPINELIQSEAPHVIALAYIGAVAISIGRIQGDTTLNTNVDLMTESLPEAALAKFERIVEMTEAGLRARPAGRASH